MKAAELAKTEEPAITDEATAPEPAAGAAAEIAETEIADKAEEPTTVEIKAEELAAPEPDED